MTDEQLQAFQITCEAVHRAEEVGIGEGDVAFTLMTPTGVLTRTLAEVREERDALARLVRNHG